MKKRTHINPSLILFALLFHFIAIECSANKKLPMKAMAGLPGEKARSKPLGGVSCRGGGPDRICIGLKYVTYKNYSGESTVDVDEAIDNLNVINRIWGQCGLNFEIDRFESIDPGQLGLSYQPMDEGELTQIRETLQDDDKMLVVTTGTWNRAGSLGFSPANAWTALPGESPFGVIMEKPVGAFPMIMAHELGHYLSLGHIEASSELMNPIVYPSSTDISYGQCEIARDAALSYWPKMLR